MTKWSKRARRRKFSREGNLSLRALSAAWAGFEGLMGLALCASIGHPGGATALEEAALCLAVAISLVAFVLCRYLVCKPLKKYLEALSEDAENCAPLVPGGAREMRVLAEAFNRTQRQLSAQNARLSHLSATDYLTGAYNRLALDHLLEEMMGAHGTNQQIGVMMFDLDNFKDYNDAYGHPSGDCALKRFAACLAEEAGAAGGFVARVGGEEFVIVLPDASEARVCAVAQAVKVNLALRDVSCDAQNRHITCSAGSIVWRRGNQQAPGEEMRAVLKRADEALYRAKAQGRNRHCAG
ncbi:MAG: GGDEF domain-containing protein [Clostridia bacterium]